MAPRFSLTRTADGDTTKVVVTGEIGVDAAAKLGYAIVAAVAEPGCSSVVVDLSAVTAIDEHSVEVLVTAQRSAAQHGRTLRIASPSPSVIDAAVAGLRRTGALRDQVQDVALWFLRGTPPAGRTGDSLGGSGRS